MSRDRLERFRRWVAYKIMPGTSEFNVAVARQRAMQELSFAYERAESSHEREGAVRAYRLLADRIPVRENWHTDFRIGESGPAVELEVSDDGE
ncbi:hypothetical protein [Natrinema thermotolerans]|uniref:hypothetical protein n=1 Tax=Natrinema thermotolerans TaxID=121872 RepID=UPI0006792632|nr:hypothetical protein [Natrinema thermotolerans]QCC57233.1 hypothetical protein DVR14_00740 [Natrinema thermotolerans]